MGKVYFDVALLSGSTVRKWVGKFFPPKHTILFSRFRFIKSRYIVTHLLHCYCVILTYSRFKSVFQCHIQLHSHIPPSQ